MTDDTPPNMSKFEYAAALLGMHPSELRAALQAAKGHDPQRANDNKRRQDVLPRSLPPIGLAREIAAAYIDVSTTKFDQMVTDGRMPKPKKIDARRIWDRRQIDAALGALAVDDDDDDDNDEWNMDGPPMSDEEYAKTQLNQWEQVLLFDLYRRGKLADATTIKGAGPATRARLAARGLITDDGTMVAITDEGRELARSKSGIQF